MGNKIILRTLGKSGLQVTPIGLGTWQFSKRNNMAGKIWPDLDDELIRKVVQISLDGGINWFDTAEIYGNGASEIALAKALTACGKNPHEVLVATKWWPLFRTASNISKTIGKRLEALTPFPIDLFQVHQPFGFSGEVKEMDAMAKLVGEGKIRAVGVSNFSAKKMHSAWEVLKKQGIPLASNQVQYSLLNRKIESNGIMETAKELGISIIAWSPLAQGLVTGKFHDNPELLKKVGMRKHFSMFKPAGIEKSRPLIALIKSMAVKYNTSPAQVSLNWLINFHGDVVVAIPGATKEHHARENTGAMGFNLTSDDMTLLEKESAIFK